MAHDVILYAKYKKWNSHQKSSLHAFIAEAKNNKPNDVKLILFFELFVYC